MKSSREYTYRTTGPLRAGALHKISDQPHYRAAGTQDFGAEEAYLFRSRKRNLPEIHRKLTRILNFWETLAHEGMQGYTEILSYTPESEDKAMRQMLS